MRNLTYNPVSILGALAIVVGVATGHLDHDALVALVALAAAPPVSR